MHPPSSATDLVNLGGCVEASFMVNNLTSKQDIRICCYSAHYFIFGCNMFFLKLGPKKEKDSPQQNVFSFLWDG